MEQATDWQPVADQLAPNSDTPAGGAFEARLAIVGDVLRVELRSKRRAHDVRPVMVALRGHPPTLHPSCHDGQQARGLLVEATVSSYVV